MKTHIRYVLSVANSGQCFPLVYNSMDWPDIKSFCCVMNLILWFTHRFLWFHIVFFPKMSVSNLYLRPEPRYGMKKQPRCWDIRAVKSTLGQQVCDRLPFVHAILGCDTTSNIHGFGKGAALKLICTSEDFQEQADVLVIQRAQGRRQKNRGKCDHLHFQG